MLLDLGANLVAHFGSDRAGMEKTLEGVDPARYHLLQADLGDIAEAIKRTSFKITRMGELVGRKVCERLGVGFGIVDLSLAPTPAIGDSVANILEAMGLERCGARTVRGDPGPRGGRSAGARGGARARSEG